MKKLLKNMILVKADPVCHGKMSWNLKSVVRTNNSLIKVSYEKWEMRHMMSFSQVKYIHIFMCDVLYIKWHQHGNYFCL